MVRSYSLVNSPSETAIVIVIGVKKELGRSGRAQRFIHDKMNAGDKGCEITISRPRNNFALERECRALGPDRGGHRHPTPLALHGRGGWKSWADPGSCITPRAIDDPQGSSSQLATLIGSKVNFYFSPDEYSDEPRGIGGLLRLDIASSSRRRLQGCAAPLLLWSAGRMLDAFEAAARQRGRGNQVHVEHSFSNTECSRHRRGASMFVLARIRPYHLEVRPGKTFLDVLLELGIDAPRYSCLEGVCSSCETRVIVGHPRSSRSGPEQRRARGQRSG